MPPAAIKIEVPKSGCVITKRTGTSKARKGKNKYFILLTSEVGVL